MLYHGILLQVMHVLLSYSTQKSELIYVCGRNFDYVSGYFLLDNIIIF